MIISTRLQNREYLLYSVRRSSDPKNGAAPARRRQIVVTTVGRAKTAVFGEIPNNGVRQLCIYSNNTVPVI